MMAHQPLWRECVEWLDRWGVLRSEDFPPDGELITFGRYVRDGVVLCRLIAKMDPSALDFRLVCQNTFMSQYVSLKNIRLFLRACRKFDLVDSDLFAPPMLFDLTHFGKVISCLSKLSKCPKVAELGIEGFPSASHQSNFSEDENLYLRLENLAAEDQSFDLGYASINENIYENLSFVDDSAQQSSPSLLIQTPVDKRNCSINELIETERKYIEDLDMIISKFMIPLSTVLKKEEKDSIFFSIEKLQEIHKGIYSDLIKACRGTNRASASGGLKMHQVFLNWKEKMLVYGEYCSNLPLAQQNIEVACTRDKIVADELERCQCEAGKSYTNLIDQLMIPTYRILKYHLLLKSICDYTDKSHEDYQGLCLAHEGMIDLSEYINEARRDYEMRQILTDVQASISDWSAALEDKSALFEYGRLIKDGELKIRCHSQFCEVDGVPSSCSMKLRYIFLFNRGLIFCKATRMVDKLLGGDQYTFRLLLPLNKYKLEDCSLITQLTIQNRDSNNGWNHQWLLIDRQTKQTAYTFAAKSFESKNKWFKAFKEALDGIYPEEARKTDHNYELQTFTVSSIINCDVCHKLFKGTLYQGYKCTKCNLSVHKQCVAIKSCGRVSTSSSIKPAVVPPPLPPPNKPLILSTESTIPSSNALDKYPWYAGEMPRETAISVLKGTAKGTFLLRYKSSDNSYALSLKTYNEVKHMKVVQTADGAGKMMFCYLSSSCIFHSIAELVDNYTRNSLNASFRGLNATLEIPWRKVYKTARVIDNYDGAYAGENNNLLTILRDQYVIIVNKDDDARGWWRGRLNDKEGYFLKSYVVEDNTISKNSQQEVQCPNQLPLYYSID